MNNEPLKVGDIAYVFRSCIHCGNIDDLGEIIRVEDIVTRHGHTYCCNHEEDSTIACYNGSYLGKYLWCLKRIPPLEELDKVKNNQKITA